MFFFLSFPLGKDCASSLRVSVLDPTQVWDKGCSSPDREPWRTATSADGWEVPPPAPTASSGKAHCWTPCCQGAVEELTLLLFVSFASSRSLPGSGGPGGSPQPPGKVWIPGDQAEKVPEFPPSCTHCLHSTLTREPSSPQTNPISIQFHHSNSGAV